MKACNSCGKCCVKYSDGRLSASEEDIALWESLRPDIAEFVSEGKIWFDPKTGEPIRRCPWLVDDPKSGRYLCNIYFDRPEDCRVYPSSLTEMINDDCEMLENGDLDDLDRAQSQLNKFRV